MRLAESGIWRFLRLRSHGFLHHYRLSARLPVISIGVLVPCRPSVFVFRLSDPFQGRIWRSSTVDLSPMRWRINGLFSSKTAYFICTEAGRDSVFIAYILRTLAI